MSTTHSFLAASIGIAVVGIAAVVWGSAPEADHHSHLPIVLGGEPPLLATWSSSLPAGAEWEKAARGTTIRAYPWGDGDPSCSRANSYNDATGDYCVGDTSQVGSYSSGTSQYGALDMAGKVWEWVNDWGDGDYYETSPYANPPAPVAGAYKMLRGGSTIGPSCASPAGSATSRIARTAMWGSGAPLPQENDRPLNRPQLREKSNAGGQAWKLALDVRR